MPASGRGLDKSALTHGEVCETSTPTPEQRRYRRSLRLTELGFDSYKDYIASSLWRRTRSDYWRSDRAKDCICGATEGLVLHHLTYERIGEERLDDLTPLCPECHSLIHALEARGDIGLDFAGLVDQARAAQHKRNTPADGEAWGDCHYVRVQRQKFMRQVADGVNAICDELPAEEALAELIHVREATKQIFIEQMTSGETLTQLPAAPPMGHARELARAAQGRAQYRSR